MRLAFLQEVVIVDALLVAAGRSPNVTGLGLEAAGVQYNKTDGIKVRIHTYTYTCMAFHGH